MRRLKTLRRPPIYPKTPGHLPCSSLTHPLPLSSRRPSVSFGGFGTKGAIGGYLFKPDNRAGELIGFAVFSDKDSYVANADDPDQDRWFRRLRDLLEADPTWEDGEYVAGGVD